MIDNAYNYFQHLFTVEYWCESGWDITNIGDRYICLQSMGTATWTEAANTCNGLNSTLPLPLNSQEDTDLYNSVTSVYGLTSTWIDGTDQATEGDWRDSNNNELTFFNWRSDQPDNNGGNEHYIHYRPGWGGKWNDHHGTYTNPFVCAKELIGEFILMSFD